MTPLELAELKRLYRKSGGGLILFSDLDFARYAALRKQEYQDRKAELAAQGMTNIRPVKDDAGDIVGWNWGSPDVTSDV